MYEAIRKKRIIRAIEFIVLDAFSIFLSYMLTIAVFLYVDISLDVSYIMMVLPIIITLKIIIYFFAGLYKIMIEYLGFSDILRIAALVVVTNSILFVVFGITDADFINYMAFIFIAPLEMVFLTVPRIIPRAVNHIRTSMDWNRALGKRTLIIGAGSGGERVIKEIYKNKALNNIPVAFVDDNLEKIGSKLLGIRVIGPISKMHDFIDEYDIEEVIIAIGNMTLSRLQNLIEDISEKDVKIKRLPLLAEVQKNETYKIMDVKVEDLLERDEVDLDNEEIHAFIKDEAVLVTGGGGSIGSELCRQIASMHPKKLIIFDIYENNAYDIQTELQRTFYEKKDAPEIKVLIGSVYNKDRLEQVFKTHKPTIVFHAAAYKHVPLMEDSPMEAIRTNMFGTYNAALLSKEYKVKNFVLISSDKAVRPTNVMGATKRFAELIIERISRDTKETRFASVRFGNVLGSNGSVIPLFKKQLKSGGPITVTHPDVTRDFMTIPEAVGLILQCAVLSKNSDTFVLDMGTPVKIKDLAEKMIRLAGYKPYKDIDIVFIGLRPGEKLFEELLVNENTNVQKTSNSKIYVETRANCNGENLKNDEWKAAFTLEGLETRTVESIKHQLSEFVTSYQNGSSS